MTINQEISDTVRWHRKKAGLSQKALADLAGVGKTVIYDIEHGKDTIRMATLLCVLEALNIRIRLESPLNQDWVAEKSKLERASEEGPE